MSIQGPSGALWGEISLPVSLQPSCPHAADSHGPGLPAEFLLTLKAFGRAGLVPVSSFSAVLESSETRHMPHLSPGVLAGGWGGLSWAWFLLLIWSVVRRQPCGLRNIPGPLTPSLPTSQLSRAGSSRVRCELFLLRSTDQCSARPLPCPVPGRWASSWAARRPGRGGPPAPGP